MVDIVSILQSHERVNIEVKAAKVCLNKGNRIVYMKSDCLYSFCL